MKYKTLYHLLLVLFFIFGTIFGEGKKTALSSRLFRYIPKNVLETATNDYKVSFTNGTRLIISEFYNGISWSFFGKSMQLYSNGNLIRSGGWFGESIIADYTYNLQNQITEMLQLNNGILTWNIRYLYSGDGKPLGSLQLYWNGSTFDTVYRTTYTTDGKGFILQMVTQFYSNNQWIKSRRTTYTRDTSGNQLTSLSELWTGAAWVPWNSDSTFYSNGRVAEKISKTYSFGTWSNSQRITYSYDGNGDNAYIMYYRWISNIWTLYGRDVYTTLPNNNIVLIYPNTKQTFTRSDSIVISWTSSGVATTNIDLSTDNGASWSPIVHGITDTSVGFYTFKNTTVNSSQCLIRVSNASQSSVNDKSIEPFELSTQFSELIHRTGTIELTVFNTGHFGNYNGLRYGAGFNYKGSKNPLFSGGVIVSTVTSGLYGAIASMYINSDLIPSVPLDGFTSNNNFNQISSATFTLPSAPVPLQQLLIQQSIYSKAGSDYVYCVYKITNISLTTPISNLQVGLFADWDIGYSQTNLGGISTNHNLAYEFNNNSAIDPNYYGIVSLNNFAGAKVTDSTFNSGTRMKGLPWISKISTDTLVIPKDYRSFIGSGPYNIPAGGSIQAGFALVGAADLAELQKKADTLINTWQSGILDVQQMQNLIPQKYSLLQNYPNPFNPRTTLRYDVPQTSRVKLQIFNMLGQVVATLLNEQKDAGYYETNWDAANYPSGVYFYRIEAIAAENFNNRFVETKKMLLLK